MIGTLPTGRIDGTGITSVIQPKRPNATATGWSTANHMLTTVHHLNAMGFPWQAWMHKDGLLVISAVEKPDPEPGEFDAGPEYHLSISAMGQRCTSAQALWALGQFDLIDAKEDNHVPSGRVRNFWRPVADRFSGFERPCQESEPAIREDKGDFVWRGITR